MTFEEPEPGVTIIRLTQTEVPDEDRLVICFSLYRFEFFCLFYFICYLFSYMKYMFCRYGNSTVVENTERGWKDLIFHKLRAVFGFGI